MRILVTGSSGMLGSDICRLLSACPEHRVYGLDNRRPPAGQDRLLADFTEADISQDEKLKEKIIENKPELVIHAAACADVDGCQLDPRKAEMVNALGTKNIAQTCKEINSVVFYISTDYVFDGKKGRPYTEDDAPNPINIYGRSKLKGENYIKKISDKYIIIRSSWLFGQPGRNFVETILTSARTKGELNVVSDQIGSPTYTLDLAAAIKELVGRLEGFSNLNRAGLMKIYHITNSGVCSWHEFACRIIEYSGLNNVTIKPVRTDELRPLRPAPRPAMSVLDNSLYNKLTRYPLRSWQEALSEYLKAGY